MQHVQCDAGKGDLETEERSGLPKRCTSQPHRAGLATLRQSTLMVRGASALQSQLHETVAPEPVACLSFISSTIEL